MPEPTVAIPNKAIVIFAALMPVIGLLVILGLLGAIAFVLLRHQSPTPPNPVSSPSSLPHSPPSSPVAPPSVVAPTPVAPAAPVHPVVIPPPVAAAPPPPAPPAVNYPPPSLTDFDPPISGPGTTLTLHGENLGLVNRVLLISSHGAQSTRAIILSRQDKQMLIVVPPVSFADYQIVIAAFSPGGVAILADQHTLSAESYSPDSHPHDTVVSVHGGDEILAGDRMVIFARPGADVSMGNDCIAFLSEDVRLKGAGTRCHIYFVPPAPALLDGVNRDGLKEIKALSLNFENDAFRVKPAPPGQDQ
jgi:hypothetical protein